MNVLRRFQPARTALPTAPSADQRNRSDTRDPRFRFAKPSALNLGMERFFDLLLAGIFLVPTGAVIGWVFILYRLYNRNTGSFFYRHERLGKEKKPFQMYKIRTLKPVAEQQFSKAILTPGSGLELKFGKFLRSTRLDELPQLFNIIRGEMRFIGPRPLRPAIYQANCRLIPRYDLRFSVKPGLFGYSQILTPHTAPKRVRAFIDNRFIVRKHRFLYDIVFIAWAIAALIQNLVHESAYSLQEYYRIVSHRGVFRERRKLRRISGEGIGFSFHDESFAKGLPYKAEILSLNNDAVAIASDIQLEQNQKLFVSLEVWTPEGKTKRVQCKAFIYKKRPYGLSDGLPWFYVLFYIPTSEVNRYILEQYILKQSISKYLSREYRIRQAPQNQRRMRRISGDGIRMSMIDKLTGTIADKDSRLLDINSQTMRISSTIDFELGTELEVALTINLHRKKKAKTVHCHAWVYRRMNPDRSVKAHKPYILNYQPVSEVNRFLLEKYVLKQSIRN